MSLLERQLLECIAQNSMRMTFVALQREMKYRGFSGKKDFKAAVKNLLQTGVLMYTSHFGSTFLELSCLAPFQVSPRIIVKAPDVSCVLEPEQIAVNIRHGAAFGCGDHPSTRIALRLVEFAVTGLLAGENLRKMLDIGTGSGILALAGLGLGIQKAVGTDIDSCARVEAMENARCNNLQERMTVTDWDVETLEDRFDLITANLRYPTLMRLAKCMSDRLIPSGAVVLSGLKTEESDSLIRRYTAEGFEVRRKEWEQEWIALALFKPGV